MIVYKIGYFNRDYCEGRKLDQYYWVSIMTKANSIIKILCTKIGKLLEIYMSVKNLA